MTGGVSGGPAAAASSAAGPGRRSAGPGPHRTGALSTAPAAGFVRPQPPAAGLPAGRALHDQHRRAARVPGQHDLARPDPPRSGATSSQSPGRSAGSMDRSATATRIAASASALQVSAEAGGVVSVRYP